MQNIHKVLYALDQFLWENKRYSETSDSEMMDIFKRERGVIYKYLKYPAHSNLSRDKDESHWLITYANPTHVALDGDSVFSVNVKTLKVKDYGWSNGSNNPNTGFIDSIIFYFSYSNAKRDRMINIIDENIVSYMMFYNYKCASYTAICIDRMGVDFSFRSKIINEYLATLEKQEKEYVVVILEDKSDKDHALCFILEDKTFTILKVFENKPSVGVGGQEIEDRENS